MSTVQTGISLSAQATATPTMWLQCVWSSITWYSFMRVVTERKKSQYHGDIVVMLQADWRLLQTLCFFCLDSERARRRLRWFISCKVLIRFNERVQRKQFATFTVAPTPFTNRFVHLFSPFKISSLFSIPSLLAPIMDNRVFVVRAHLSTWLTNEFSVPKKWVERIQPMPETGGLFQ